MTQNSVGSEHLGLVACYSPNKNTKPGDLVSKKPPSPYKIRRLRKKAVNYEDNTPRCENCKHFCSAYHAKDEHSVYVPPHCSENCFPVSRMGLCDVWTGKDGSTLDSNQQES